MDTTYLVPGPPRHVHQARPAHRARRYGQALLVAAGLVTVLLTSACDTAQQVPWASYGAQLQVQIDAATATHNCAALQAFLQTAKAASHTHERATGFPNDALVSYIQAAQQRADCPAGSG
jgi:hypothetical protein